MTASEEKISRHRLETWDAKSAVKINGPLTLRRWQRVPFGFGQCRLDPGTQRPEAGAPEVESSTTSKFLNNTWLEGASTRPAIPLFVVDFWKYEVYTTVSLAFPKSNQVSDEPYAPRRALVSENRKIVLSIRHRKCRFKASEADRSFRYPNEKQSICLGKDCPGRSMYCSYCIRICYGPRISRHAHLSFPFREVHTPSFGQIDTKIFSNKSFAAKPLASNLS